MMYVFVNNIVKELRSKELRRFVIARMKFEAISITCVYNPDCFACARNDEGDWATVHASGDRKGSPLPATHYLLLDYLLLDYLLLDYLSTANC